MASSWQNPIRSVLTPAESTSVSSVRLPTPIISGTVGIPPAGFEVAAQRGREPEADRLEDRVDAEGDVPADQGLDRLVQAVERARHVGDGDDLDAPIGGPVAVGRVDAQDQVGPRGHGPGDLDRVEAVDRDAEPASRKAATASPTPSHEPSGSQPRSIRSAPSRDEPMGLVEQRLAGEARGVVDLGEDLDVERAVAFEAGIGLAEVAGQVEQVLGTELDGDPRLLDDRREVAPAVAGEDDAVDPRRDLQVAGDPAGRHQGGDRDRQDGHLGPEARARGELLEHLPQRELGQATRDEEQARARQTHVEPPNPCRGVDPDRAVSGRPRR